MKLELGLAHLAAAVGWSGFSPNSGLTSCSLLLATPPRLGGKCLHVAYEEGSPELCPAQIALSKVLQISSRTPPVGVRQL